MTAWGLIAVIRSIGRPTVGKIERVDVKPGRRGAELPA